MSATAFAVSRYPTRTLWVAAALSVLLHVALIASTLVDPDLLWPRERPPPAPLVVEMVALPDPEPEPAPPPPPPAPALATPINLAPPPPQLEEAPIGPTSQHAGEVPAPASPTPPPVADTREAAPPAASPAPPPTVRRPRQRQPTPADLADAGLPPPMPQRLDAPSLVERGRPSLGAAPRRGGTAEQRQQSEGDFVLAQIMPHWLIDVRSSRFRDVVLGGTFYLQADGTLSAPYGRNDPWAPERMIDNYRALQSVNGEPVRVALESFLRAARAAQPFRLPPGATGGYPRPIRIVFKMGDL